MTASRRETGRRGEAVAVRFLEERGYTVESTNWHCLVGEVDIVAMRDGVRAFVEVRTRRATTTEPARASISGRKRGTMLAAAYQYLSDHDVADDPWRIDLIAIAFPPGRPPVIDHVEDALDW